jgi:hypothetical protein
MATAINLYDHFIDSLDVIERIKELQENENRDEGEDYELENLLEIESHFDGDSDWHFGVQLINENSFIGFCEDLVGDDIDLPWYVEIDWKKTANNIRVNYSEIEIKGYTFLY